jgi:hypothetical protein
VGKLRKMKFFQEGQTPRKEEMMLAETLDLRPEGICREGNGTPRWIDERKASETIGVAVQTLRNWRFQGTGPAYYRAGRRAVRYRLSDIVNFMELRRVKPFK